MENLKFYNELMSKYTIDDFTGHIGVLLAEDEDPEYAVGVDEAWKFLEDVYNLAVSCQSSFTD